MFRPFIFSPLFPGFFNLLFHFVCAAIPLFMRGPFSDIPIYVCTYIFCYIIIIILMRQLLLFPVTTYTAVPYCCRYCCCLSSSSSSALFYFYLFLFAPHLAVCIHFESSLPLFYNNCTPHCSCCRFSCSCSYTLDSLEGILTI